MKCVIKEKRIKGVDVTEADRRIAFIKGEEAPKAQRPIRYENLQTGEEYLSLHGGFAWPGLKPGFAVVLAVQKSETGKEVNFKCLEEIEDQDVNSLVRRSYELFQKYGKNCHVTPWAWYGDNKNGLNDFAHRFNQALPVEDQGFFLAPPPYFDQPNCFEIYSQTIRSLLTRDSKRLYLGSCSKLRASLSSLGTDAAYKDAGDQFPAVNALGSVLTAMIQYQPWLQDISVPSSEPEDPWGSYDAEGNFYHDTIIP